MAEYVANTAWRSWHIPTSEVYGTDLGPMAHHKRGPHALMSARSCVALQRQDGGEVLHDGQSRRYSFGRRVYAELARCR
jgi:hypothetical protein